MIPNNNLNILPFYNSLEEQDHRKFYAYGHIYTLIAPDSKLLPFQINREHLANSINLAVLYNYETGASTNILSQLNSAGLNIKSFAADGYDLIVNPSAMIFPTLQLSEGRYYLKIGDGVNTWYSELFTVVADLSKYLKLEYWDSAGIAYTGGHVDYSTPFRNYCYLQTEIGKPEYPFEEEAQQRDGFIFIEKQISEKKYKFEFLAPEYLCDALRIVRMHDFINIYFRGKKYSVENIIFDPKWREQGNLAVMEVEFECDTIIKKIGRGVVPFTSGDFNNDYSDDFDNN